MKKVSIIRYSLKGVPITKRTLIHRALYGYIDHSNKGEYTYKRDGLLKGLKYTKIGSSVLMLDSKEVNKLKPIFKKYDIKIVVFHLFQP